MLSLANSKSRFASVLVTWVWKLFRYVTATSSYPT